MKLSPPISMSLNAGYVDTAGFLALQGLFTAHVTGNFVTLGAALVNGSAGALAKLLALPVFCAVIVATRVLSYSLPALGLPIQRTMLSLQLALLVAGGALAIAHGPFGQADDAIATLTGMVLVAAMAIQNAASRIHLAAFPPTTLMTGTTTQMMIDVADLLRGVSADASAAARARLRKMGASVLGFALGCAGGAILFHEIRMWCFAVPPVIALIPVLAPDPAAPAAAA